MTDHLTENARLRAALAYYADQFCEGFCNDLPEAGAYHISMDDRCSGCKARNALTTPAPDAVQEAARSDRLADAAKTLLSVDEYGNRKEVYAACEGRVKVYKFDAALTRLSHARAHSQETHREP